MIDFDKVLEHVGGFGKYQITSKLCDITYVKKWVPAEGLRKRAIWDGRRPDYLRVGMGGSLITCPVNSHSPWFSKNIFPMGHTMAAKGYGKIHTYDQDIREEGLRGRASERKESENESGSDPTGSVSISVVVYFQGRQNMQ